MIEDLCAYSFYKSGFEALECTHRIHIKSSLYSTLMNIR